MIVGGFETLEEYLQWLNEPTDPAIVEALDQATEAGYLEDELLEEIRREAEGEEPLDDEWEMEDEEDDAPLEREQA